MKQMPTRILLIAVAAMITSGCAGSADKHSLTGRNAKARAMAEETEAWLQVADLETRTVLKLVGPIRIRSANLKYATIEVVQRRYLIETDRECPALMDSGVFGGTHDYRMKRNMIRAGYDTLRGCRIETIYVLEDKSGDKSGDKAEEGG